MGTCFERKMFLAKKIKEESEVGYILYMWQLEDIVRAFGCDAEKIIELYIPKLGYEGDTLKQEQQWWRDIVEMMRSEGILQSGHLQMVKGTLSLLSDKHAELLSDTKETLYNALYYKALPFIVELRSKGANREKPELEICFEALYGVTLLKMKQQEISKQTQEAHDSIANLLTYLNKKYKEEKLNAQN